MTEEPAQRPLAILTALGSRGDVNPMLGFAVGLQRVGIDTLVVLPETYVPLAAALGLKTEVAISHHEFQAQLNDPRFWQPYAGARLLLADWIPKSLPILYEIIQRHHRPGRTLLIAHPLDLASRVFRDRHPETPLISVHLAPVSIRSRTSPPKLIDGWRDGIRSSQAFVDLGYWLIDRLLVRRWLEKPLNRFRRQLGLAPVSRPLHQWWFSPDRVLCFFPEWFGPSDAPSHFRFVGFPRYDGPEADNVEDAEQLLQRLAASSLQQTDRPIVFTAGSAHLHGEAFFQAAVDVCRKRQWPALLLTSRESQIPCDRPAFIQWASYIPLGLLLPNARAMVHHGGIGTTSQALAASTPQLICPMAFDQFDNGERVKSFGCGDCLPMSRLNADQLEKKLVELLRTPAASKLRIIGPKDFQAPADVVDLAVRNALSLLRRADRQV